MPNPNTYENCLISGADGFCRTPSRARSASKILSLNVKSVLGGRCIINGLKTPCVSACSREKLLNMKISPGSERSAPRAIRVRVGKYWLCWKLIIHTNFNPESRIQSAKRKNNPCGRTQRRTRASLKSHMAAREPKSLPIRYPWSHAANVNDISSGKSLV